MKKSILSLIIIAALFMVPILSFEASALTAYGQPCTTDRECASGICRVEIDTVKVCGCNVNSDCPGEQGCEQSSHICKKGYSQACSENTECASGICTTGRCACSSNANCPAEHSCISGQCKINSGAACNPAYPQLCASGYCNPTTRVCGEVTVSGVPVTESETGTSAARECNGGLTCVSGKCEGQKANNAACTTPYECSSGICSGGKCKTTCMRTADCANGKICDLNTGTCIAPRSKALNAACFQNDVCQSGSCYNSKCRACASNSDCITMAGAGSTGILGGNCVSGVCQALLENRAECYTPDQCKSGICAAITGTTKKCGTVCSKDEHCGNSKICDLNTGTCITPRSKDTNAACFQNEVCKSGLCYNSKCQARCETGGTIVVTGTPATDGSGTTTVTASPRAEQTGTGTPSNIQSLIDEINALIAKIQARMVRLRL